MTCDAELHIADSYGDNYAAIRCQSEEGHPGPHRKEFQRDGKPVIITFECDERERCSCGALNPTERCKTCYVTHCGQHEHVCALDEDGE